MNKLNLKRLLSLFLALVMVLTMVPTPAHAEDGAESTEEVLVQETEEPTEETIEPTEESTEAPSEEISEPTVGTDLPDGPQTSEPAEKIEEETEPVEEDPSVPSEPEVQENPYVAEFQLRIDELLARYSGDVEEMDERTLTDAYWDTLILEEDIFFAYEDGFLSEAEVDALVENNPALVSFAEEVYPKAETVDYDGVLYTERTVLDGKITLADSANNGSVSDNVYTANVKGSTFSKKTNTITITNNGGAEANISFSYSASNYSSLTVADASASASGTYSGKLAVGGALTIKLVSNSGLGAGTATLTLSSFSWQEVVAASDVTFVYDTNYGSVTVDGTAVDTGTTVTVAYAGATLTATAKNGAVFVGWVNTATHEIEASDGKLQSTGDKTVRAVFAHASASPWFNVDNAYLTDDLTAAVTLGTKVTLAANGTLSAGDYIIPSNVTLLIPYDSAYTLCTTKPTADVTSALFGLGTEPVAWVKPTAYRTLTMASGANITVNGAISVSAKSCANQGTNGMPTGPVGFIQMNSNSSITVNSGANLYCWGYISGSGSIVVRSGGNVYEAFQVRDWRGGSAASDMINAEQRVFPLSQYYIQTIEVPLTLEAGSMEYGYMGLVASYIHGEATVPLIGQGGMFVPEGTIIKDYIEETDRLQVIANGNLSVSSLKIVVSSYNMDSSKYVLPVTNNMDVIVNSGTATISQDMAMLPGATIQVNSGATLKIAEDMSLFVYDLDDWAGKRLVYNQGQDYMPLTFVSSGTPVSRSLADASIIVNGTLDSSAGYVYTTSGGASIISTGGGKVITGTPGTDTITYQADQVDTDINWVKISITPAKLKNADGSYTETTGASNTTYTYLNGYWHEGTACSGGTATCTAKAKCSTCGVEYGSTKEHTEATREENRVEATCGAAGSYDLVTYCSVCNTVIKTEKKTLTATGNHSYDSVIVTKPATCTEDGVKTYTCGTCGGTKTETIAASGHDDSGAWQLRGEQHYKICQRTGCGIEILTDNHSEPNAEGKCDVCGTLLHSHSYTESITKVPTCTEEGVKTFTCSCGDSYTETIAKNPDNHTGSASWSQTADKHSKAYSCCKAVVVAEENHEWSEGKCSECGYECEHSYQSEVTPPTCASGGYTTHTCTGCGNTYTDSEIEATAHSYSSLVTKEATCKEPGVRTYTCNGCGDSYTEEIEKLTTHTPAEAVVENRVESTCTAEGSYDNVVYCTVCKAELSRNTVTVDKIAHAYDAVVTAPTCTKKGYTTYTCTTCGDSYVADETEMIDHTPAEAVKENEKASSCTVAGSYDEVVYCSVCGAELSRETKALELAAHTEGEVKVENNVAPTCTATGSYDNVVYCTVCNAELSRNTVTVEKIAHTPAAAVEENRVESTCTVAGSYESVVYCSACNTELSREAKALELAAHTEGEAVVENKVDATCTAEGSYENVVYCTVCNAELSRDTVTVDKIAHAYNAVVTAPTCTAKGYTTYTCTACGDSYVADETEMVAHTPAAAVEENRVESTCTVAGSYESVVYCSACKTELSRDTVTVEKASHAYNTVVTAPTCTAKGYTTYTCSACGNSYEADLVEATGHSYERNYTGPTFEADGFTTYTCHCGDTYTVTDEGTQLTAVAQIDDKKFQTLAEAFEAAKEDENDNVIELLVKYTVAEEETWNLGSDTLVIPAIEGNYGIVVKGSLTVEGGTFLVKGIYGIGVTGELLIQGGAFTYDTENEDAATDYLIGNWGETTIEGGTFQGQYNCVNNFAGDGKVTITGGTFRTEEFDFSGEYPSFDVLGDSGVEISGGSFSKDVNDHAAEGYCAQKIDGLYVVAEHNYTSVVTEPTCTAGGYTTHTCSRCSASYMSDEVAHLGHNWQDATCTAPKTCSVCQATEGDKLAHSFTEEVSRIAATCNENGSVTRKCATCDATEVEVLEIDPDNHDIVRHEAQAPTCTAIGWDAYETCSRCDYTTYAEKAALGHNEVPHEAQDPTCTAIGWDAYETCSRCDYTTYVEKAALGHNLQDVAGKASTCTEDGYTAYKDCSRCDYTEGKAVVPATGHVNTTTTTVDATCTAPGSVTVTCKCGVTVSTTVIPAKNHIPAEAVRENEKAATCGADGSYDSVVYCSVETCKAQISRETVTVPANGNHDWKDATYEAPKTCSVCKLTEGEKKDRPAVEVVEPEDVTPEKADDTVTDEAAQEIVESVVNASGQVEQPKDTGIEAEDNKAALENAAGSNRYDTSLVITVNSVVVAKDGDSAVAKSVTYEVSPMLYVLDETGTQTDAKKIEKFESPITFHLPVDNNTRAIKAQVWHEQTLLGSFEIREDSSGNKFVEVTSATFSKFTVAPVTECTDHEYVDGVCKHCGAEEPVELFDISSSSIVLGNELAMYFFIQNKNLDGENYTAVITKQYADGRSNVVVEVPFSEWTDTTNNRKRVRFDGIAAKEMSDDITVVIYRTENGKITEAASNPYVDSIRSYVERGFRNGNINDSNKELGTMLIDMLNYGAAAQRLFEYGQDELANKNVSEYQDQYATKTISCENNQVKGIGYKSVQLTLKSQILFTMRFYKTDVTQDMTAVLTFTDHRNNTHTVEIAGTSFESIDNTWGITTDELVVSDGRQIVSCVFYDSNGNLVEGVNAQDSIESFCARAIAGGGGDYYEYIMKFCNAAYNYFH